MTKPHIVYLSLGSNLGDRKKIINDALQLLETRVGHVERVSSFYETEPWGFSSANKFINACVCCLTSLSPHGLLEATQQIEIGLGRTRKSSDGTYYDRLIDIDILLYDDIRIDEPDLKIPHPHMKEREFVMEPLEEILSLKS
ncbi:MAG: 2-amino-4-hydroxy-6-hydroxymethyldihydropteridine diphosphokinase [Prevotella sp.]|jgi:2-amino-4-hydroxy-6-hydroxymethyldihydropteridine diphosphokinase|nr:2-amino-4-hydroxy-6-hydroxymethyldihydropteridine diphosphokinase [Prevotella sp.]MCI1282884.1 2-amino-4-hydroxy-6-hydroxymethyldihydropteridine diphosphokinase [Prevotella sp.]